jgi:RNA polymerase sigma factor (sigma-70 family)
MNELVARWSAEHAVNRDDDLVREFEAHVSECSSLVVRVAYSVVRNKSDAEDVAQEAFVRAYRGMRGLRDRTKFRAWLVRMTWRLALDWRRTARRRDAREDALARISPQVGDAGKGRRGTSAPGAPLGCNRDIARTAEVGVGPRGDRRAHSP